MRLFKSSLNRFVTSFVAAMLLAGPVVAQDQTEIDRLLGELVKPDQQGWQQIEESVIREWSKSGSPAMDLLLKRGTDALTAGDYPTAIEHLTALTDHAPEFAEGWNARATAFFHLGQFGASVADIERTLALNPQHFGAMSGLAVIFEELKYRDEALEVYRAVAAIHPHRPAIKEAIERLEKTVEGARL